MTLQSNERPLTYSQDDLKLGAIRIVEAAITSHTIQPAQRDAYIKAVSNPETFKTCVQLNKANDELSRYGNALHKNFPDTKLIPADKSDKLKELEQKTNDLSDKFVRATQDASMAAGLNNEELADMVDQLYHAIDAQSKAGLKPLKAQSLPVIGELKELGK